MPLPALFRRGHRLNSFTLIELLVVILIIAILAALTMIAGESVMNKGARARATAEIQGISAALESYKADNGAYPWTNSSGQQVPIFTSTNDYTVSDGSSLGGTYMVSAQVLYEALSGLTNFSDTPIAGTTKTYMPLKANMVGNATTKNIYSTQTSTYMQDPFGYAYGYYAPPSTGNPPYNGTNMFDLWTTAGTLTSTANWTNSWIDNWQPQ